jgi:hypothetical protein
MTITAKPSRLHEMVTQETEDRYRRATARLLAKWGPDAREIEDDLDSAVLDALDEVQYGAVHRHGRQIQAMIEGTLYTPRGCAASELAEDD